MYLLKGNCISIYKKQHRHTMKITVKKEEEHLFLFVLFTMNTMGAFVTHMIKNYCRRKKLLIISDMNTVWG